MGEPTKHHTQWLLAVGVIVLSLVISVDKVGFSDLKRDEGTAAAETSVNPLRPMIRISGEVIDNTVNKVLPFDVSTESQLVRHEKDCYRGCERVRDEGLKKYSNPADRGSAWKLYYECKEECPIEAANKAEAEQRRVPAGSALEGIRSR
jgi:hypothetical protein